VCLCCRATCSRIVLHTFLLATISKSFAKVTDSTNIGLRRMESFPGSSVERVQVDNSNLHIEIPLYSVQGSVWIRRFLRFTLRQNNIGFPVVGSDCPNPCAQCLLAWPFCSRSGNTTCRTARN